MAVDTERVPSRGQRSGGRLAVLGERDFRWFFVGYATSLFGSSMAPVAVAFAVLDGGGGGTDLGWVMAARILPIVLVMLVGGVVADRLGSRRVMLVADVLRCGVQGVFAAALAAGHAPVWVMVGLVALWGLGEGVFLPALGALVPALVARKERLPDANTLLGLARSVSTVAGPATAGVVVAAYGPAAVLLVDAVTYGVGALALARLGVAAPEEPGEPESMLADLREGWSEFRSRPWLWITTVQMAFFNLLVWAPFLVLGPLTAQRALGGARGWGLVMGVYGAGAVLGGLLMLGRRPVRPLAVATAATLGWALPSAALAAGLSLLWTAAVALVAGAGSAVCGALYNSTMQRWVPADVLARVTAFGGLGAFVLGPLGLAAAGPLADRVGAASVLGFGALWQLVAGVVVLAVPAVSRRQWDEPAEPGAEGGRPGRAGRG
ncbi:MFS transporter [Streptomyces sp. CB01881]|uniref:MFS transporter n=1 Tax=Streptomyces sp. CB01881 TaxID=2078691 RepID=UPI000CDBFF22|nr:MFS transporter [Streptomyces sp. CB01881]AUY51126.1 MFS transporter [Streptomyces sp. CB01881]TYC74510.1 MFS transporter [Streptomyces sp. CB01881]